jgi:antitoxin ParD1/3/4
MTLNVSLTPQLEELIKSKVSSGMYTSASELVREALRLLEERDHIRELRLEALRREIQKGVDSGPGIPADEVFNRLEKKYLELARNSQEQ